MRHSDVAHCCAIIRIVFHLSRAINFPPIRAKSLTWAAQWRQETQVRLKLSTRCHLSCLRRPSVCLRCMSGFPARACPPAMMIDRDVLCHHRLFHRGARSIRRPRSLKKMPVTSLLRHSPSHVIWGLWYAVLVWHSHTTNRSVLLPSACERHTPWETRERESEGERESDTVIVPPDAVIAAQCNEPSSLWPPTSLTEEWHLPSMRSLPARIRGRHF